MKSWLPWVGGAVGVFLLLAAPRCWSPSGGWEVDTTLTLAGVKAREDSARSLLARGQALMDSGATLLALGQRRKAQGDAAYRSALYLRDSLDSVAIPDTCAPFALGWRQTVESLLVAHREDSVAFVALEGTVAQQDTALTLLRRAYDLRGGSIDSLKGLVRRAPTRKWWVPEAQIGYGAVVSDGAIRVGPGVQVGFRIRF